MKWQNEESDRSIMQLLQVLMQYCVRLARNFVPSSSGMIVVSEVHAAPNV